MAHGYTNEVLRNLQLTELEILKVAANLCSKYDITWFLDGGTALGARRHGGFIPWDDDIDIGMPRESYERFLSVARKNLSPELYLVTPEAPGVAGQFSKICKKGTRFWTQETIDAHFDQGIFIDVFPYDYMSGDIKESKRQLAKAKKWSRISYLYHSANINIPDKGVRGAAERLACHIAHPLLKALFSQSQIVANFNKGISIPQEDQSSLMITFAYPYYQPIDKRMMFPTSDVEFEGCIFPTYYDIEAYLEEMYGENWTELPPFEQRKTHAPLVLDFGDGVNAISASNFR